MRWSRYYIPTLKEAPADAEVISHKLLLRAGMIRKLTSGIYTWLPLGLKTLEKAKAIVRAEMNRAGSSELLMPAVQPAELWRESGRWTKYGRELLRFRDRHDRDCCFGPTHEEVITDLVRGEVRSYRQLPLNLYQIQFKFRDEIRPRFGLMRGREFLMKDAYSFDRDEEGAEASYRAMHDAYIRVFRGMALDFRVVEADSGAIGGKFSHEFMVMADTGEDAVAACTDWPRCSWAANMERAPALARAEPAPPPCPPMEEVSTPNRHTVDAVSALLGLPPRALIKTLLFSADGRPVAALVRGDRELNEIKFKSLLGAETLEFATPDQVLAWTGAPAGFAGPVGLADNVRLYADLELAGGSDWVAGANKSDVHVRHLDLERDVNRPVARADLRNAAPGDPCPVCGRPLEIKRGIEVGHIFKLDTRYSLPMRAVFLDENGREQPMIMGCYGIGVSRVVAACIEQNHDGDGILFPPPLAPFDVHLICLDPGEAGAKADEICAFLEEQGLDVLYDDREERPGVKFKDADLLGIPARIVVGGKSLARGTVEGKNRRTGESVSLSAAGFRGEIPPFLRGVLQSWER